jgi:hypothetical protein
VVIATKQPNKTQNATTDQPYPSQQQIYHINHTEMPSSDSEYNSNVLVKNLKSREEVIRSRGQIKKRGAKKKTRSAKKKTRGLAKAAPIGRMNCRRAEGRHQIRIVGRQKMSKEKICGGSL